MMDGAGSAEAVQAIESRLAMDGDLNEVERAYIAILRALFVSEPPVEAGPPPISCPVGTSEVEDKGPVPIDPSGGDGSDPAPDIRGFAGERCTPPPVPQWTPPSDSSASGTTVSSTSVNFVWTPPVASPDTPSNSETQDEDRDGLPDGSESAVEFDLAIEGLMQESLTYPIDPAGGDGRDPAPEIRGFAGDRCTPPPGYYGNVPCTRLIFQESAPAVFPCPWFLIDYNPNVTVGTCRNPSVGLAE
jgi:hypothetical protein